MRVPAGNIPKAAMRAWRVIVRKRSPMIVFFILLITTEQGPGVSCWFPGDTGDSVAAQVRIQPDRWLSVPR